MEMLLQQVINGLTIGSVYALLALGFTMIFGVLNLINFAHGEFFSIGAYVSMTVLVMGGLLTVGLPLPIIVIVMFAVAIAASSSVGVIVERLAYRPIGRERRIQLLITSLGVSIFLQNAIMLLWGKRFVAYPEVIKAESFEFAGAVITNIQIMIIVVSVLLMWGLHLYVQNTRMGKAMRATSLDPVTVTLMGVNVNRIVTFCFILGSGLGGVAGVMVGLQYGVLTFMMGFLAVVKAFTAVILGGMGNIPGAVVGGLILGMLEAFGAGYISAQWKDVIAFVILIVVLVLRPTGLLGERTANRV